MPNRILRDWTDSLIVNELSAEEERFFIRLIMKVDDFGRFHANPQLLKAALFPLLTDICPSSVSQMTDKCQSIGLLVTYKDEKDRKFLQINNFNQRTRARSSKFPAPDGHMTGTCQQLPALYGDGDGDGDGDAIKRRKDSEMDLRLSKLDEKELSRWNDWLKDRKEAGGKVPRNKQLSLLNLLLKLPKERRLIEINNAIHHGWKKIVDSRGSDQDVQTGELKEKKTVMQILQENPGIAMDKAEEIFDAQ